MLFPIQAITIEAAERIFFFYFFLLTLLSSPLKSGFLSAPALLPCCSKVSSWFPTQPLNGFLFVLLFLWRSTDHPFYGTKVIFLLATVSTYSPCFVWSKRTRFLARLPLFPLNMGGFEAAALQEEWCFDVRIV